MQLNDGQTVSRARPRVAFPHYEILDEFARAGAFSFYRAVRGSDGASVLVKIATRDPPSAEERERLRREWHLLSKLRIAGVPRAHEILDGALVLEHEGGVPLARVPVTSNVALALNIGAKLAAVLAELHRLGITHNAIHPSAIVFDAESGRVCLIDFANASLESASPTQKAHGDLVYCSPEQTGRMNRTCDYRTDFYSLGVVLYELLTGAPPFESRDALKLMHAHIARTPAAPADRDPTIPLPLSSIVMKLLAKTAEERYQSALGLKEDFESCAREWHVNKQVAPFPLGRRDASDRFLVSQKLYGRETEVAAMLAAFDRVCQHRGAAMMLVAGYSGIGKTSLIHELYKPIVRERGYFVSGKFDQVVRSIPFGALIQAFHGLLRQFLTESEERLARWRTVLSDALGANGGVLAEVIPEIELIVGPQPSPPALGPTESLNRFQLVFQNFVAALAREEHPLVVFLDDLQWADSATLSLFQPLLTSPDIQYFFLLGAYRDNEVDATHPLARTLRSLESSGIALDRVSLGPLRLTDLTLLIQHTLHSEKVEPLANLVLEKTGGNPFFVIQFLHALKHEGFLEFDYAEGKWHCRLDAIRRAPFTDNVIDLMTRKIQRLSKPAQRALTLAACIGNPFDVGTLAVVSEQKGAATDLSEAVEQGLVLALDNELSPTAAFAFLHDRVQQAAYSLIPEAQRQFVHLTVGRLLCSQTDLEHADAKLFDVVHHLNLGSGLITEEPERLALAKLNLSAGRKAKSSTAFESALGYFEAGVRLLIGNQWQSHYELAFALNLEAAECQYLCGKFDEAERSLELLLSRAKTSLDQATIYRLRGVQCETLSRYADALAIARRSLALFGFFFPDSAAEKNAALEREIKTIQLLLGERSIESLVELPVMSDPEIRMVMNILTDIWSPAYIIGDPTLARLISATLVRLSLNHGNVEESAYGYVTHAITVGPVLEDYAAAYEFGALALKVNERFNDRRRRAKIYQQFHAHVALWRQPMQTCIPYAREACRAGLESGDFLYAAYGASTESWPAIVATQDLEQFVRDYTPSIALIRKLKVTSFADALRVMLNWARALRGETRAPVSLSHDDFDEEAYLRTYRGNVFFTTFHAVAKLSLCYLFGEYENALQAARSAKVAYQLSGTIWPVLFDFWNGLTLAANFGRATKTERKTYLEEMEKARQSLATLAENCPENFLCQSLVLSAEISRVTGHERDTLEFFERAIRYAEETGMLQHRALANELYGRFQLERGQEKIAGVLLNEARACYAQWGAKAKVAELERRYPVKREMNVTSEREPAADESGVQAATLDLVSVMKAAHAIAGEIELGKLLQRLMLIAIENAGAERGALILEEDGAAFVHAEGRLDQASVHPAVALGDATNLSQSIVNYVRRTATAVVLSEAEADDGFGADPYIARNKPRSIMCVPVLNQGRLIGVFYLENNVVSGAFTAERIQIMKLLSAQAAISLENARLFDGLRREIGERTIAQKQLRAALDQVEALKNELEAENIYLRRDLIANVSHDLRTPLASLRGYLETLLMKEDTLPPDKRRGYLRIAARQSERLASLVAELFELARLDFKGVEINREPVKLDELARDVVQKFELVAEKKQLRFVVRATPNMPFAHGDIGLLERAFENLIHNALHHSPNGGTVEVDIAHEDHSIRVAVADHGAGISKDDLPHIFDRFYRADKSRSRAGAGLGLAITKRIVELHGSRISVKSSPEQGTCFEFALGAA